MTTITTKFTYRRVLEFQEAAAVYRRRLAQPKLEEARARGAKEEELKRLLEDFEPKTKFYYAVKRVLKGMRRCVESHAESVQDISVEHASTDDKGVLEMDGERFRYTRDGMKQRLTALRKLMDVPHEVEPYFATEIPPGLTEEEVEAFLGFVLRPDYVAPEPEDGDAAEKRGVAAPAPPPAS